MNILQPREADRMQLGYALSKQTPSMRAGFVIQTSYGDIAIDAADAGPFADLLDAIITEELREVV